MPPKSTGLMRESDRKAVTSKTRWGTQGPIWLCNMGRLRAQGWVPEEQPCAWVWMDITRWGRVWQAEGTGSTWAGSVRPLRVSGNCGEGRHGFQSSLSPRSPCSTQGPELRSKSWWDVPQCSEKSRPGHHASCAPRSPRTLPHGPEGGGGVFLPRSCNIHRVIIWVNGKTGFVLQNFALRQLCWNVYSYKLRDSLPFKVCGTRATPWRC